MRIPAWDSQFHLRLDAPTAREIVRELPRLGRAVVVARAGGLSILREIDLASNANAGAREPEALAISGTAPTACYFSDRAGCEFTFGDGGVSLAVLPLDIEKARQTLDPVVFRGSGCLSDSATYQRAGGDFWLDQWEEPQGLPVPHPGPYLNREPSKAQTGCDPCVFDRCRRISAGIDSEGFCLACDLECPWLDRDGATLRAKALASVVYADLNVVQPEVRQTAGGAWIEFRQRPNQPAHPPAAAEAARRGRPAPPSPAEN